MIRVYLLLAMTVFISLAAYTQASITLGPWLQSPTTSGIKVMWHTDSLCASKVMYGTSPGSLTMTVEDTALVTAHMLPITGLQPYTKYYYAIYLNNTLLEGGDSQHTFRTFPVAGTELPIRAWVIGDFGKGNSKQAMVRDSYLNFDTTTTDLWLWLGDNAYNDGTEQEFETKVFDSVYGYKKLMSYLPFEPTPGNHDYNSISPVVSPKPPLQHTGPYYDLVEVYRNAEAGGVASGNELYYSFDYGNAHFISLNSEIGSIFSSADDWTGVNPFSTFTSSPMSQWLEQDLQANTQPWVIVYFHQTPYTDGSHESGTWWEVYMKAMREHFAPIWEQYGVDLVVCGHTHVYERSYLVKGSYGDVTEITPFNFISTKSGIDSLGEAYIKYTQGSQPNNGTVYVNNGNSGSTDAAPGFNHPYMYSEYGCDTCCGSFILDINGNRLDGRHLDMYGNIRDHFTIYKINGAPSGVEETDAGKLVKGLKVFPNPFSEVTTVAYELAREENLTIQLTDVTGRKINLFSGTVSPGKHTYVINAAALNLAKGLYVLQLTSADRRTAGTVLDIQ